MNIKIICIGKLKEKYWVDAVAEYSKRLKPYCSLEIAEQYSQTGEKTTYKQLTDEDFTDISLDMTYAYNKQPWTDKDYSDYIDGYTWGFKYYNAHGKETYIYGGYTDGCDELESGPGEELSKILIDDCEVSPEVLRLTDDA